MAKLKTVFAGLGAAALLLTLVGCGSGLSSVPVEPPTPENPVSIEDAGYGQYYTQLPDSDLIVQCFERGAGKSRVLTCFEGSQDIPKDELREFTSLNFGHFSYVDAGGGVTVACIADGIGKRSVLTCFPIDAEETVASEQ